MTELNIDQNLAHELKSTEDRFMLLIHVLGEGVGIVDQNEIFILANESAEEIFQVGKGELLGRSVTEFLTQEGIRQVTEETAKRKEGIKSSYELEIITAKKEKRIIIITATPYLNKQHNFEGSLGVFRDITERKRMEQELISLNADKNMFMQILAHDLRGPFSGLISYSDMLLKNFRKLDADKIEKQLTHINRTSKATHGLLEDLLIWSKSQAGKLPFEPAVLDLAEICDYVISEKIETAELKQIEIENNITQKTGIYADKNMLKTILRNLLSNAVKFTNRNGRINVKAEYDARNTLVTVSDNGIGMTKDEISKLWNCAKPHSTEGTEKESGTGLGLLLCKEFVEKHGGNINVKSEPGKGTDFVVSFPLFNLP
jgi:PAS domain S-box-containing protein